MNEWEKVQNILEDFDTAMLVTEAADGKIHARPMAIADFDASGDIWFITGEETGKVHEIEGHNQVNVICQDGRKVSLSVSGTAELVRDRKQIERVWQESFKTWFPEGKDDPSICLIRVHPSEAEYWDNSGWRGAKYLFSAAKAYAKGQRPKVDEPEQHGNVKRWL